MATGSSQGTYIGESGRTLYERSREHLADATSKKASSHIWKHWALCHGSSMTQPPFSFKVLRVHRNCLERQVHEGIRIAAEGDLNSKSDWRQNQLKRISVHLTEKEMKEIVGVMEWNWFTTVQCWSVTCDMIVT